MAKKDKNFYDKYLKNNKKKITILKEDLYDLIGRIHTIGYDKGIENFKQKIANTLDG